MTEMLKIRLICDLKIEKENYGVNVFSKSEPEKKARFFDKSL